MEIATSFITMKATCRAAPSVSVFHALSPKHFGLRSAFVHLDLPMPDGQNWAFGWPRGAMCGLLGRPSAANSEVNHISKRNILDVQSGTETARRQRMTDALEARSNILGLSKSIKVERDVALLMPGGRIDFRLSAAIGSRPTCDPSR
jgi:hypothetical protein